MDLGESSGVVGVMGASFISSPLLHAVVHTRSASIGASSERRWPKVLLVIIFPFMLIVYKSMIFSLNCQKDFVEFHYERRKENVCICGCTLPTASQPPHNDLPTAQQRSPDKAIYPIFLSNIPYIGQQYTLYWSAIYPILVCNIPYILVSQNIHCALTSVGCWFLSINLDGLQKNCIFAVWQAR